MSGDLKIPILPGGMLSDIVETELGPMQHQTVKNLRQTKEGLWEAVKGCILLTEGPGTWTDIKAAIEIDDEYSGERFILFQHATSLNRITYHAGDGNGYENETAAGVSLPSGVTIGAAATLRFFYFRGVVRITGASHPMWYSYVKARSWFADALETIDTDDFHTTVEGWAGDSATAAVSTDQAIFATAADTKSLKVTQTGSNGSARKTFTIVSGEKYVFRCWVWKDTAGSGGDPTVKLGKAAYGGTDYGSETITPRDAWVFVEKEFTASTTALYVEFNPGSGAADDVGYLDYVWLDRKECKYTKTGWVLVKAELLAETLECAANYADGGSDDEYGCDTGALTTPYGIFGKYSFCYDDSQYSLPANITRDFSYSALKPLQIANQLTLSNEFDKIKIQIPGTYLEAGFLSDRITGLAVFVKSVELKVGTKVSDDDTMYLLEYLDFTNALDDIVYERDNFYWVNTTPNRLYFNYDGTYTADTTPNDNYFHKGAAVTLKTVNGEIDTTCVRCNGDAHGYYVEFADALDAIMSGSVPEALAIGVTITRKWYYDPAKGYLLWLPVNAASLNTANEMYDYIDIPAGTTNINPNYKHHVVIEDRAYVDSQETDEQDVVRYSPLYQFDSFPAAHVIQTQVGDIDAIRAIVKLRNRLVILKQKSFSQGNFSGGSYYEDIGIAMQGVYPTTVAAFLVVEDVLYFMDQEDVFVWNGVQLVPLLNSLGIKEYYKTYVAATSFFCFDKQNNEMWLVLSSSKILVYDIDRKNWYLRETSYTLRGSYLDTSNQLIGLAAAALWQYNHSSSTFGEQINWQVVTKIFDLQNPHAYKKAKKLDLVAKSNKNIAVACADDTQSGYTYAGTVTPSSTVMLDKYCLPYYIFKQLQLTLAGSAAANNITLQLRGMTLEVTRWK